MVFIDASIVKPPLQQYRSFTLQPPLFYTAGSSLAFSQIYFCFLDNVTDFEMLLLYDEITDQHKEDMHMKIRLFVSLIAVLLLTASLSLTVCAADWNLALQGNLNITSNEDYTVISADSKGNPITTNNTISIADNITTTITLDNVAILAEDIHGIQLGSGASVTLNLVGENCILNESDSAATSIKYENSNLTITSKDGGTLKLNAEEADPGISISGIDIEDIQSLDDIDANHYVITEDGDYYTIRDGLNIPEDIETEGDGIISIEIIDDESTPLSDGKKGSSTITIEGNAQIHANRDVYAESGSYIISIDTVINGVPGWDIEELSTFIPFAEDYSDLILVANGRQFKDCSILENKSGDISAIVSGAKESVKLTESALKDKALTDGIAKKSVLRSCHVDLGQDYKDSFILRFLLDDKYAGQDVEIRSMKNGKVVSETVTVSALGLAAIVADAPGNFAVIAK